MSSGDGHGYGDGDGHGSGYGDGHGSGYGSGYGTGYGSGYGHGYGSGTGYGDGDGTGYGWRWPISLDGEKVRIGCKSMTISEWLGDAGKALASECDLQQCEIDILRVQLENLKWRN